MRGTGGGGRIVNVAARPALEPRAGAGMLAYTASKAAVAALTQALAEELASEGIWVNAVAPSILDTTENRAAMPGADHASWPAVEEVAATIVHLASSRCAGPPERIGAVERSDWKTRGWRRRDSAREPRDRRGACSRLRARFVSVRTARSEIRVAWPCPSPFPGPW
jgi:NAD(P)-dependent dehydrogenase (short-subunit alcohol dehydrogenase family)